MRQCKWISKTKGCNHFLTHQFKSTTWRIPIQLCLEFFKKLLEIIIYFKDDVCIYISAKTN